MTISVWIPGETLMAPAAKLTDLPSTDLMTTGLGLKSAAPLEAPRINALSDSAESDVSIVSVMPQPDKRHTDAARASPTQKDDRASTTAT